MRSEEVLEERYEYLESAVTEDRRLERKLENAAENRRLLLKFKGIIKSSIKKLYRKIVYILSQS